MTSDATGEPNGGKIELRALLQLLNAEDLREFWNHVGKTVLELNHKMPSFANLCNAVRDIKLSKIKGGPIKVLPGAARVLASETLRSRILENKDRLLDHLNGHSFLSTVYCQWLQVYRQPELCAVLDVMKCPHDGRGSTTDQTFPSFSPEDAAREILALTSSYSTHTLALVCGGLIINTDKWHCLEEAFFALQKTAPSSKSIEIATPATIQEPTCEAVVARSPILVINAEALKAIREGLTSLQRHLENAIADTSAFKVPDLQLANECWRNILSQHTEVAAGLGVSSLYVKDLEAALALRDESALVQAKIKKCRLIVHSTNDDLSAKICEKCDELEKTVSTQGSIDPLTLSAVNALIELVKHSATADEELAAQLQTQVEGLFGKLLATAAVLGRLSFSTEPLAIPAPPLGVPPLATNTPAREATKETETLESSSSTIPVSSSEASTTNVTQLDVIGVTDSTDGPLKKDDLPAVTKEDDVQGESNTSVPPTEELRPAEEGGNNAIDLAPKPVEIRSDLTTEFESFTSFKDTHWVDASGSVALAPWKDERFFTTLAQQAKDAWEQGEAGIAFLFSRALATEGVYDPLGADDLASADNLLADPTSQKAGIDPSRANRLLLCLKSPTASGHYGIGLTLFLEALRPTLPSPFDTAVIESLLTSAAYRDPALTNLVRYLLLAWHAELNPLTPLRARLIDAAEESIESIEATVRDAQNTLRVEVATLWNAAGGKIQQTHSRSAWIQFMQTAVAPVRDELAPKDTEHSKNVKLTPKIQNQFIKLVHSFDSIMGASQVRHRDKSIARGAAEQIFSAIDRVTNALQRLDVHRQRLRASYDGMPYEAARRLISGSGSSTFEKLFTALFTAVLQSNPQPNLLRLKAGHLINHVCTITHLNSGALSKLGVARDGICISDFDEPILASVLLLDWRAQPLPTVDGDREFLIALRNTAAEQERTDVLAALLSTDVLQPHEKTHVHRRALELGGSIFEEKETLSRIWGANNELMLPSEPKLKSAVEEAQLFESSNSNSITSSLLFLAWLKKTCVSAGAHLGDAAKSLLELAMERPNDHAARMESYFRENDYRAGAALYYGIAPTANADRLAKRRTILREDALNTWSEPMAKLANDLRTSTDDQGGLIDIWVNRANESGPRDSLPKLFYSVISGEAGRTTNANQKRFPFKLSELREHKERKTIIKCETVRTYFQKSKMNPTFLPQLADFNQIVILSAPQQANRSSTILDDLCKAVGNEPQGALVVFLSPKLSRERRDEICVGLRKRGVTAAVIDDTDLCRLCAVSSRANSGHDFTPLLEILLEQLDLDRASPFSSLDGQHVRLESYTGRTQEAEKVALRGSYTRVFSGRKLGKSALLKYVANNFDLHELPSGNTLNIFFITIAGGDSERWVVDCIIDEMAIRFGLPKRPAQKDQSPAERFSEFMRRFLQEKPRHSVLFILDEADAFIEGQLSRYDVDREASLSFRMMKELPAQVDSNQLPRIRTIFSGYRVTNTRGGVWANAGDVLVLRPLAEDEAVNFLEGMLTRIGIALGDHASYVAMRCGFQPAVLIRFGESLIKRLKKSNRSASRETLRVSNDDVLATLGEQEVLDEIKTVVNNNFQGNRVAAVIFGATLLALKDLKPGLALTEGPAKVKEKLQELDPNLDWLERIDTSPLSEIERNLQDFIDRELLTVSDAPRFGEREYRLRFPHFLPVLTQQSEIALEVRQQIQAIRGGASQRRLSQCVLSESALDTVRYWHNLENPQECKLIVVGGHWTAALLDSKCGVPDRLGYDRTVVSLQENINQIQKQITDKKLIFGNVTANSWKTFLDADIERPLVLIGNLDLLRTTKQYALEGGPVPVEVVTLGRLTDATLAWWFEDARALHFKSTNAISRITQATGLVPFLVGIFDKLLPYAAASEVSERALDAALNEFQENITEWARSLCDSSNEGSLTIREIELLKMAVQTAEHVGEFDLESDFRDYWPGPNDQSLGNEPFGDLGDWAALKMLVETGLIPTHSGEDPTSTAQSLGTVRYEAASVLVSLIKALGQTNAS